MTLIKSISGIRGTIGGDIGASLSPFDIVRYTAAYSNFIKKKPNDSNVIVIGRDARISGLMVSNIISGVLISSGFDVLDIGLSTTPTVEMIVKLEAAAGGIIITASHNPKEWNALKLLNNKGEFLSAKDGNVILEMADNDSFSFKDINSLGRYKFDVSYNNKHIDEILKLPLVNVDLIKSAKFKVVLDAVNSTGGIYVPLLLKSLGVECVKIFCEPTGEFPHNPEPLPENLKELSMSVIKEQADLGFVVDPDVDRLAIICEDGSMFGEEYTLVTVADYILSKNPGNTVSNLSSTRALKDITNHYNCSYSASAVGEVNVVEMMKKTNAVIGGEGNGGIIYPELHYGRDALVGIALFLSHMAERKMSVKEIRESYPNYFISKNKINVGLDKDLDSIFCVIEEKYKDNDILTIDGLKIIFKDGWVHLRKSNTEPIIRIYAESNSQRKSDQFAKDMIKEIKKLL